MKFRELKRQKAAFSLLGVLLVGGASFPLTSFAEPAAENQEKFDSSPSLLELPLEPVTPSDKQAKPTAPKVGDVLRFRIKKDFLKNLQVDPKSLKADPSGLDERGWALRSLSPDVSTGDLILRLSPVKAGRLSLPSIKIQEETRPIATTQPLEVEVASAIKSEDPKPMEPEGLAPPVGLPFPLWMVVLGSLLLLGFCSAVIYFLVRWFKKWRASKNRSIEVHQPEDVIALAKLDELEKSSFISQALFKEYYFKLSEILKEYIGARYQFDALESTTGELLQALQTKEDSRDPIDPEWIHTLKFVFERLDRVKFTDFRPIEEEAHDLLGRSRAWVKKTRKVSASVTGEVRENAVR